MKKATYLMGLTSLAVNTQTFADSNQAQPNVLFIIADDLGYSDLSYFGSEIDTPNLDELASESLIFNSMQSAPTSSPSRAMLWTGVDNHKAGLGNMLEEMAPNQVGQKGYEGTINNNVVLISETLQQNGYNTSYTGKWHLSKGEKNLAYSRGFTETFSLNSGGASHFNDMKPAYAPTPESKAPYSVNGTFIEELPSDFEYSSQFFADKTVENITASKNKPFFSVVSFTAPHWPLQAPQSAIDKVKGRYDKGYEVLYNTRLAKQKKLGFIDKNTSPTAMFPEGKTWGKLTAEEKKYEIKTMEVYAAMIEEIDVNTGKIINKLKETGQYENTMIVFLSDNGVEGHTLDEIWPMEMFPKIRTTINNSNDFSYESLGKPGSYAILGPNWARASSPGFYMFKGYPDLGGTRITSFVKFPHINSNGVINNELLSIKDFAPTVLEITNNTENHQNLIGTTKQPITGISLADLRNNPKLNKPRTIVTELFGKVSVINEQWIMVGDVLNSESNWKLFNAKSDVSATQDVSKNNQEVMSKLVAVWKQYKKDNNVIIPNQTSGY